MHAEPKHPWWRKKRWLAAVAIVTAVIAYPLTVGPVYYGIGRGWLPSGEGWLHLVYSPAGRLLSAPFRDGGPYADYQRWWFVAGLRGRPRPEPAPPPPIRGELPRLLPTSNAASGPVDLADLPPPPAP